MQHVRTRCKNQDLEEIQKTINNCFLKLLKKTTKSNKVFVHRDFHIENLIIHNKKIAFLDTQDAVIGHPAYDLMSLVDDVRVNISQSDQSKLIKYYFKKTKKQCQKCIMMRFWSCLENVALWQLLKSQHKNVALWELPFFNIAYVAFGELLKNEHKNDALWELPFF